MRTNVYDPWWRINL
ncbi:Protein of unknown function [Lactobacillus helveticus CIRM-BIA 104]|uniref:Uncharacterized protein n=1 Tax=Lactobacillus helveticus CIRM-BIA 104 TaxID=1226333 RepID=U6FCP1_LACHE|nr:Protein of unknown function [Lactobacillus helveticus CIRM-BIA 104]